MPTKRLRRGVFNICGIRDVVYKRYFAVPFVSDAKRKKFLDDVKKTASNL
jgi:NAD(P)H dehydrogenase (quinone)